jgi:hypothetical protein
MKTITVPKSADAQKLLDLDQCPIEQLEELVLSQDQFDKLWSVGFFYEINRICGSLIDDYEDEAISAKKFAPYVLEFIQSKRWSSEINGSIKEIETLFAKAKEYNTSVYFYF